MAQWGQSQDGKRVVCLASRYDDVDIRTYDRVRFYPVVRDALAQLRAPVCRANFHFACVNQEIADLAMQEIGPKIRSLLEALVRGAHEFGYQVVEKRWVPKFEVSMSSTQSDTGASVERFFPFVWTIKRFASFDPSDTRLEIYSDTGDFAGVRQFVGQTIVKSVPGEKCVHFVNERQFDSNYGQARTKSAVPFVELAESNYDDMGLHSRMFAVAWKVGRHKPGKTVIDPDNPDGGDVPNSELMDEALSGMEAGHTITLPAEYDAASGKPLWEIGITQPPGEENYVEKAQHLNDMIRIATVVPEMASSSSPDTGTYNLGERVIDLFLTNIEDTLDQAAETINDQLLPDFVLYNYGSDAPACRIVFEPLDVKVKRAILQALIQMLSTGEPIEDGDGNELQVDWAKLAQDAGVVLKKVTAKAVAHQLVREIQGRLQQLDQPGPKGEQDTDPDDVASLSEEAAGRWDEAKHPREEDGKFAPKGEAVDGDADGAAPEDPNTRRAKDAWKREHPAYTQKPSEFAANAEREGVHLNRLGGTSAKANQAIEKLTGEPAADRDITIDEKHAWHAVNKHAKDSIPLTASDFDHLAEVVNDHDAARLGHDTGEGAKTVLFVKQLASGAIEAVGAVLVANQRRQVDEIRVTTLYKKSPGANLSEAVVLLLNAFAPSITSETPQTLT